MRYTFEEEFRLDHPETVGETDSHFDLDNYKDWLEAQLIEARKQLALLAVSTRTFKVGDKVKWRGMDLIVVEVGMGVILIATSENVEDDNYDDWWVGTQYVR